MLCSVLQLATITCVLGVAAGAAAQQDLRVVFVSPTPTLSSCNQFVVVAEELRSRGIIVEFAVPELIAARPRKAGFIVHPMSVNPNQARPWEPGVRRMESRDIISDHLPGLRDYVFDVNDVMDAFWSGYHDELAKALELLEQPVFANPNNDTRTFFVVDLFALSWTDVLKFKGRPFATWVPMLLSTIGHLEDMSGVPDAIYGSKLSVHQSSWKAQLTKSVVKVYCTYRLIKRVLALGPARKALGVPQYLDSYTDVPKLVTFGFALEVPRPISPLTTMLGLVATPSEKLPLAVSSNFSDTDRATWNWLTARTGGVLYVSFGSEVIPSKELYGQVLDACHVLSTRHAIAVLLALRQSIMDAVGVSPSSSDTLRIEEWVNQPLVLRHAHVGAFLTHGGLSSLAEAVAVKTPLAVMPFFGDQPSNAHRIEERGIGIRVNRYDMNATALAQALASLFTDSRYKAAMERAYEINFAGRTPAQKGADAIIALAAAAGDYSHLAPPPSRLLADEWTLLCAIGILVVVVIGLAIRPCCRCCCSKAGKVKAE